MNEDRQFALTASVVFEVPERVLDHHIARTLLLQNDEVVAFSRRKNIYLVHLDRPVCTTAIAELVASLALRGVHAEYMRPEDAIEILGASLKDVSLG